MSLSLSLSLTYRLSLAIVTFLIKRPSDTAVARARTCTVAFKLHFKRVLCTEEKGAERLNEQEHSF